MTRTLVTTPGITDSSVTTAKLADGSVTSVKIAGSAIVTAGIADSAVTYAKIQNVSASGRLLGRSSSGAGVVEEIVCTAFGRSLIDDLDAAAARATLGALAIDNPSATGTLTVTPGASKESFTTNSSSTFFPQISLNNSAGDSSGGYVIIRKGRSGFTTSQSGDTLGTLLFQGYDTANVNRDAVYVRALQSGAATSSAVPADLSFVFGTTERVRLSPLTSGGSVTGVSMLFSPNGEITRSASIQSVQPTAGTYADLRFVTANGDTPAERMRIAADGSQSSVVPGGATLYPEFKCRAWVYFDGTTNSNLTGTYSQSGTTVTATVNNHGLLVGHAVQLSIGSGTAASGLYTVTGVISANQFTYTAGTSLTTSGNITLNFVTIRGSGNVSSVTKTATGNYIVNLVTAMPDTNFAVTTGSVGFSQNGSPYSVSGVLVRTRNSSSVDTDSANVHATVFR